jgi:hypothetical protein
MPHIIEYDKLSANDRVMIERVVDRAEELAEELDIEFPRLRKQALTMDLMANQTRCPIDLGLLLDADMGTFGHDVFGVERHMNRRTGELDGCFVPRTAIPQHARA